jgi:hypothetical protein
LKLSQCGLCEITEIAALYKRIIKHAESVQSLLHRSYCVVALMDG